MPFKTKCELEGHYLKILFTFFFNKRILLQSFMSSYKAFLYLAETIKWLAMILYFSLYENLYLPFNLMYYKNYITKSVSFICLFLNLQLPFGTFVYLSYFFTMNLANFSGFIYHCQVLKRVTKCNIYDSIYLFSGIPQVS